ncbi:hypothetical protein [Pseudomonas synxantha]|uniref:Uncharacterized protein n=1 Tax=Pseudomonas synxantha TaxID=47883 RepID=A0ACC6JRM6_9PSED|nr:hypothetical protein [Pseudomonas synxantha]MDR6608996.1 hypothetical protein [Pseudomonas synxantha]
MKALHIAALLVFLPAIACGGEVELQTKPLIDSPLFDTERIEAELIQRVKAGVYEGYQAELCVDAPSRCDTDVFEPYKRVEKGQARYLLTIENIAWDSLPAPVRKEVLHEIVYYTWGSAKRRFSPLEVIVKGAPVEASPLTYLSSNSASRYLSFAAPEYLQGGVGGSAYGPNCWYNSISSIADINSVYARSQILAPASWDRPRFMGPTEFRRYMQNFTEVSTPQFGDVIRYYTDAPIYGGYKNLVYGGEVHAAVYIGKENYTNEKGSKVIREVALTKNGRSDLDFLIFQDVRGLDENYLTPADPPVTDSSQQIKKGYFRVKKGSSLLDPAAAGRLAETYGSYLVDIKNYADRWLCLGKLTSPPAGDNMTCFNYPVSWLTLVQSDQTKKNQFSGELLQLKPQPALQLKQVEFSSPQALLKEIHGG